MNILRISNTLFTLQSINTFFRAVLFLSDENRFAILGILGWEAYLHDFGDAMYGVVKRGKKRRFKYIY
jgi:hypothetical protein